MEKLLEKLKKKENLNLEESKSIFNTIMTGKASDDQIYGSGITNNDELICLIETLPVINENIINPHQNGRLIFFQDTIEKFYITQKEIEEAVTNEIEEFLN